MGVPHELNRVYAVTLAVLLALAVILWVALQPLTLDSPETLSYRVSVRAA